MNNNQQSQQSKKMAAKGGYEPWRNRERHYCEICNAWMGSDRQSILLHEKGKAHQENLKKTQLQQRQDRAQQEKQTQLVQNAVQAMEAAAQQSFVQNDMGHFAASHRPAAPPLPVASHQSLGANNNQNDSSSGSKRQLKQEKKEWESRKKHRQEEKMRKRDAGEEEQDSSSVAAGQRKRPTIGDKEGYYTVENVSTLKTDDDNNNNNSTTTYLEGVVFGDLLEPDMPIQIWIGSPKATVAEQRLIQYHHLWLNGLVAAVRRKSSSSISHADRKVVDVAYLQNLDDAEETLETSVHLSRIRIVLGKESSDDTDNGEGESMIPTSLQEARIMAMGGQVEEEAPQNASSTEPPEIDESTGLSGWSTVSVKRTTVRQELKEERERLRQARREKAAEEARAQKQAEQRKLEEAKLANADDSALGAYDVWSRGDKDGYKGVDISSTAAALAAAQQQVVGKKLAAEGERVAFKKTSSAFQKNRKKKKQNRRTTSADDD